MIEETTSIELMNSYATELTKEVHRLNDELILTRAKLSLVTLSNESLAQKIEEFTPKPQLLTENTDI